MITYRSGYKYQLRNTYKISTGIIPPYELTTRYLTLGTDGKLTIKAGYAWDGASGPAIDTQNFMRGSLVHDALYQLMEDKHLSHDHMEAIDRLLQKLCIEDGMSKMRAWWVYQGVKYGGKAKTPKYDKIAP